MTKVAIWPISFCDGATDCFLDCLLQGKVWPIALLHLGVFYGAVLLHKVLKCHKRKPKDENLKNPFYFAHHVPPMTMTIPIFVYAYQALFGELLQGDLSTKYGVIAATDYQDHLSEGMAWFQTFLAVDMALMLIHRLGSMEMYVHHAIFGFGLASQVGGGHCCCAWAVAAALQQELSTPFLNVFLLLRGYNGLESTLTQAAFVTFALAFFWCRPIFATYVGVDWSWREFFGGLPEGFISCYRVYEYIALAGVIWGSLGLQYFWSFTIGKNLLKGLGIIKGKPKEKDAARLTNNEEEVAEDSETESSEDEESGSYTASTEPLQSRK